MERVLDEISFTRPDRNGETIPWSMPNYVTRHAATTPRTPSEPVYFVGFAAKIVVCESRALTTGAHC